ncbi:outer membrane lipoprotein-sorting protein [Mucilaginibacter sp. UR6-11]|uniref:outer membrane lipoprotein-sorting protein n=1 Tax=Mucilaginibacter sp. UR6-11 TaxID=1435644 RepID=UPI001E289291|nr:outer membrane lipoprotein-sorting protein [Mucilaginibacter sp. UR6-11]MCC8426496.1 outer membrane lipoprotein-sorting protein [Mucilaginibacter sp. UR6-11]
MRPTIILFFIFSFFRSFSQDAKEIVRKADEKMRGATMQAEIIIKTLRPTWSREMQCKIWTKGNQLSIILIQSPAKDKGTVFLKKRKEVWNWMPVLDRNIKLPPSMMSQSWMGTDFTNDDLVKESSIVDDYNQAIMGDTVIQNRRCYIIRMIPKPATAVVWSKVIICIDKTDFLELNSRFFDDDGQLINTMNSYDIKLMHDRIIPTRFEMIPADKKGQKTVMIYSNIQYNKPIDDNFFSVEKMKTLN